MPLSNSDSHYGAVTKTFHWLTALLILTAFPLGLVATSLADAIQNPDLSSTNADIARAATLFSLHKTVGVAIFLVSLARITWAIFQPRPGLLNSDRRGEAALAETVHWLLYGSLVLVPLTGWVHHAATTGFAPILWPFGQSLPFVPKDETVAAVFAGLHKILVMILAASVLLHVAGAVKHHVIDRDATLRRMWFGAAALPQPPRPHKSSAPLVAAIAIWLVALGSGLATGAYKPHGALAPGAALEQVQSDWQVTEGTLDLTITQLGSPVTGSFADWTAAIAFTPTETPGPAGSVNVTVAIASLTLGSVTSQAMGPDFFDSDRFPTATFDAEIARTETGYVATGPLTIRDRTVQVALPFDLALEGGVATMSGTLRLARLDFGIGSGLPDEASLAFAVDVAVNLQAQRQTGD
jgi:cytochrome b561/polyisoprenoid-binding protein YceI